MKDEIQTTSFWPIQLSFWFFVALINFVLQYVIGLPVFVQFMNIIAMALGGLLITTSFRYYLKKRNYNFNWTTGQFIRFLLSSAALQAICWLLFVMLIWLPFRVTYKVSYLALAGNLIPFFTLALIWNLIYLGYHLLAKYHEAGIARWKLESDLQKAQLAALKEQINPHFMFNALNNIRALVLENPIMARDMITNFSTLFRYALQHSEDKEVKLADELSILNQYLQLLKIQYEDKLQYTIDAEELLMNEQIPPMVLQMLVENAIKHGIGATNQAGEIRIHIHKPSRELLLEVSNTGQFEPSQGTTDNLGIGLQNIKERLQLLHGDQAKLRIQSENNLVTVSISLTL